MSTVHKNYIAGEWVDGASVSRNVNPSNTDDVVGEFAQADAAQADAAVKAAHAAFPAWARTTPQERHDILLRISTEILARREELGRLLAREEGKTPARGDSARVGRAGQIFDFFAGEALRIPGEKIASVRPNVDVEATREPVGVIGVIAPWNFPIAIPAWKIAPALAYGNAIVFKPADLVPGSAHALAEIVVRAGVPKGVFNLVMGRGSVVGQAMLDHLRRRRDHLHRVGCDRPARRRRLRQRDAEVPARNGRQESARSFLPTPISPTPSSARSTAPISRPDSAARPPRASSSKRPSIGGSPTR